MGSDETLPKVTPGWAMRRMRQPDGRPASGASAYTPASGDPVASESAGSESAGSEPSAYGAPAEPDPTGPSAGGDAPAGGAGPSGADGDANTVTPWPRGLAARPRPDVVFAKEPVQGERPERRDLARRAADALTAQPVAWDAFRVPESVELRRAGVLPNGERFWVFTTVTPPPAPMRPKLDPLYEKITPPPTQRVARPSGVGLAYGAPAGLAAAAPATDPLSKAPFRPEPSPSRAPEDYLAALALPPDRTRTWLLLIALAASGVAVALAYSTATSADGALRDPAAPPPGPTWELRDAISVEPAGESDEAASTEDEAAPG